MGRRVADPRRHASAAIPAGAVADPLRPHPRGRGGDLGSPAHRCSRHHGRAQCAAGSGGGRASRRGLVASRLPLAGGDPRQPRRARTSRATAAAADSSATLGAHLATDAGADGRAVCGARCRALGERDRRARYPHPRHYWSFRRDRLRPRGLGCGAGGGSVGGLSPGKKSPGKKPGPARRSALPLGRRCPRCR
jgi:hypothetical protein